MSATSHPDATLTRSSQRRPASVVSLAVLLGLLAIGALQGGIAMIANPTEPLGMSTSYLDRTPIDDYFLPGLFLLGIAMTSLLTIVGLIADWRWNWARSIETALGFRWPWIGAMSIGTILLAFEILELFIVPFHPVMHPLLIAGSVAILGLASTRSARACFAAER